MMKFLDDENLELYGNRTMHTAHGVCIFSGHVHKINSGINFMNEVRSANFHTARKFIPSHSLT